MRIRLACAGAAVALLTTAPASAKALDLKDGATRTNYSVGYQIGGDFKRQGVKLDAQALVAGIEDALAGAEPRLSQAEMQQTLVALKRQIVADQKAKAAESELQFVEQGRKFMEQNAGTPGVVTTPSGLQYRIVEPGSGKKPGPSDQVTCRYRGTLVDGNEFDRSGDEPVTFPMNGVIAGWTEGLQQIGAGGKIQLVVPPKLAYGDRGPLAHRTLVFEIELLSVQPGA